MVVLFLLFSACHKKAVPASSAITPVNNSSSNTPSGINKVIVDPNLDIASLGGVATSIDSITIKGDILSVFVNYGGGCKKHIFDLYSNGVYAKSLPPQLTLYLKHINNDDRCRKLVIQELKFNISSVKYKKGALIIKLGDFSLKYQ
jgi:hypothetical protein